VAAAQRVGGFTQQKPQLWFSTLTTTGRHPFLEALRSGWFGDEFALANQNEILDR
jgi:hypothetical protein